MENKEESRSGNYFQMENMLITPVKDTANPFSHQVMASLNCFNWKQAVAPRTDKKTRHICATNSTTNKKQNKQTW